MASGPQVLTSGALDVAEVDRLTADLEAAEVARHAAHAAQLQRSLDLDAVYDAAGLAVQTTAVLALVWRCSERESTARLHQARVLRELGALTDLAAGLVTVEQVRVVVDVLADAEAEVAAAVWGRLRSRLEQDAAVGAVLPPARTAELLRRWLIEADPEAAVQRRQQAEDSDADVQLWRRRDGLADIAIRGMTGPNAQACAQLIRAHADPFGADDERPLGRRLRDAAVDLILGRTALPFPEGAGADGPGCGRPRCGCSQTQAAPCGASIQVLVPLTAALGTGDEPAELVGHGPLESDLLQALLRADPVLTRVWVDPDTGVPVAADEQTWRPGRNDPTALRGALLDIARGQPSRPREPVHPDDHRSAPSGSGGAEAGGPDALVGEAHGPPRVLEHPHPAGTPGPYVTPRWLRRLLTVRSPRCEWPGCGRRAGSESGAGCDVDHDVPWPAGPTCGCNTGPLCRRHHRIKQLGWVKQRRPGGHLRWTDPTGRRWFTRSPHQPPAAPRRPLPPIDADPVTTSSPHEYAEMRWDADPGDPFFDGSEPSGLAPQRRDGWPWRDTAGDRYRYGDAWVRLDDPTAWEDVPDPVDPDVDGQ